MNTTQVQATEKTPNLHAQSTVQASENNTSAANKRLLKRETHSKRGYSASLVALIIAIGVVGIAVESTRQFLGYYRAENDVTGKQILEMVNQLPDTTHRLKLMLISLILIALGIICLVKAIAPGSLRRHGQTDDRAVYVVEDSVIASAISKAVRNETGIDPGQVTTTVTKKQIKVQVQPTSGRKLVAGEILGVVEKKIKETQLDQKMKITVKLSPTGVVAK